MRWIAGMFVAVLLVAWLAVGQAPVPAPAPGKIAVVDTNRVLGSTVEGKATLGELEKKFAPRQKELQGRAAELDRLQAELQQKQNSFSDAERQRRGAEIQQKQKSLERLNEDFQSDANATRDEALARLGKRVNEVVQKYGASQQYSLIFDSNASGAMYVAPGSDLTAEIIAAYDKQFPVK